MTVSTTTVKVLQLIAILCIAVAMAGGWAHLLELSQKMLLSREDYLMVQQIYRGWALLGIPVVGALISSIALTSILRNEGMPFYFSLAAALCVALSLVVFFLFILPVNKTTQNWTTLPEGWEALRRQWEYSHAASAFLYFAALASISASVLAIRR